METVVTSSRPSPADTQQAASLIRDRWASRSGLDEDLPFVLSQGGLLGAPELAAPGGGPRGSTCARSVASLAPPLLVPNCPHPSIFPDP